METPGRPDGGFGFGIMIDYPSILVVVDYMWIVATRIGDAIRA
jgi:hypothetical protein